jgi:hypothetical protein
MESINLTALKNTEIEVNELKTLLSQTELSLSTKTFNLNFFRYPRIDKIKQRLTVMDGIQEIQVMLYLEENDKEYQALTNKSFDLMSNNKVEFKVWEEENGIFSSHATKMKGSIHDNGFVYTDTTKTNTVVLGIEKGLYPLEYKGVINYLGEVELNISKTGLELIGGRMPENFKGTIDNDGNITIQTDQSEWQVTGYFYINKMIGDIFLGNHEKRDEFLENVNLIKTKIKEQREKIREDIKS